MIGLLFAYLAGRHVGNKRLLKQQLKNQKELQDREFANQRELMEIAAGNKPVASEVKKQVPSLRTDDGLSTLHHKDANANNRQDESFKK